MNAGTSTPRTSVASIRVAIVRPTPNSLVNVTCEVANAMKVTASTPAAAGFPH